MDNDKSTLEGVLGFLGIVSLFAVGYSVFKAINSKTSTDVISDKALEAIQDPEKAKSLREEVGKYKLTGDWNKERLTEIL